MHLKTSSLFGVLPLLLHQCVAGTLPLQQRDSRALPLEARANDITYWLHPSCTSGFLGNGRFIESLKEALWASRRISDNLQAFDEQLSNPGNLRWFYDITLEHRAARSAIAETFQRVGTIKETLNRKAAHIRILCNDDDEFKPVDGAGKTIPKPMSKTEIKQTKYYNKEDHSYIEGGHLCSMSTSAAITHEVAYNNEELSATEEADQEAQRHIIRFCKTWIKAMEDADFPLPFTVRDFSTKRLDEITELWKYGNIPMVTIIHELTHCHFLSHHDFTVPTSDPNGAVTQYGGYTSSDEHKPKGTPISGYFQDKDGDRQLMGSRGLEWEDTIMNADSYGWFALIFRLREKQWEAYSEGQGAEEVIRFKKNTQLPDQGDDWNTR